VPAFQWKGYAQYAQSMDFSGYPSFSSSGRRSRKVGGLFRRNFPKKECNRDTNLNEELERRSAQPDGSDEIEATSLTCISEDGASTSYPPGPSSLNVSESSDEKNAACTFERKSSTKTDSEALNLNLDETSAAELDSLSDLSHMNTGSSKSTDPSAMEKTTTSESEYEINHSFAKLDSGLAGMSISRGRRGGRRHRGTSR
jgi:hypothetical protein